MPTAKLRKPKAVRLRWKLSVSRPTSVAPSARLEHEVRRDLGQRPLPQGLVRQDDQAADAPGTVKQLLGNADVGEHGAWRNRLIDQNRVGQVRPKERGRLRASDQRLRAQEAVEVGVRQCGARSRARRRSQRIDADQPHVRCCRRAAFPLPPG